MTPAKGQANSLLAEIRAFCEKFAEQSLRGYTERLKISVSKAPKEINDAIWGTIKVQPLEVVVLDSPLVQRLRFVRQLGVVHWIYPGATHARFEHSLGVLYQTQQLMQAINSAAKPGDVPIDQNNAGLVRLCALLHDIGHGVFSHVSEHALHKNKDVSAALRAFCKDNVPLEKIQLSELVAYYLIGSPAFSTMLETALDGLGQPIKFEDSLSANTKKIVHKIQNAIIGKMIDERVPLLHELITGPFDADKLDYYTRDARLAGVPTMLDISRLTQKVTVESLATDQLPDTISSHLSAKNERHFVFGLKWSGSSVLDELHLARVLLYSKVYRHKKVIAAEAMVEAFFEALSKIPGCTSLQMIEFCYALADDQLVWSDSSSIARHFGLSADDSVALPFLEDILRRFRERDLFVTALVIQLKYPDDPWKDDSTQIGGMDELIQDLANPQKCAALRASIITELEKIAELDETILGGYSRNHLGNAVVITAKPTVASGTEIDRAFIFQGNKKPISHRDLHEVNKPAWASAYTFTTAAAMLLCPKEIAVITYLAAEKILRQTYKIILPAVAADLSKQDEEIIDDYKRRLDAAGFYEGVPLDIRPKPNRLLQGDVNKRLDRIVEIFSEMDEFVPEGDLRRPATKKARIEAWLAQFRRDSDVQCAMEALEKFKVLKREHTKAALKAFAEKYPVFKGGTLLLLGSLKDSSAVQMYQSQDLKKLFPRTTTVQEAAADKIEGPVIFVDDFIGSGGQAEDILANWFDAAELKRPDLKEGRLPFKQAEQDFLRSREVGFVFAAGWQEGLDSLARTAEKVDLKATVYANLTDPQIPFAFDEQLFPKRDKDEGLLFQDRCREIGRQLILSDGGDEEKASKRALGYGNRGMLLGSHFNAPTQVLTCLWKQGKVDGIDWIPLINRRPKD